jgi:hypothetical protein
LPDNGHGKPGTLLPGMIGGLRLKHRRPLVVLTQGHLPQRLSGNEPGNVLLGMFGQE